MKYFLSYKFTGVPLHTLYQQINPLVDIIKDNNNTVFCNLYSEEQYYKNNFSTKQIMEHCFNELKTCDAYICYVTDTFAGGMAIECGYAHALNLPIIMCVPKNTKEKFTTLSSLATYRIDYIDQDDLEHQLNYYFNYYFSMQNMIKNMKN